MSFITAGIGSPPAYSMNATGSTTASRSGQRTLAQSELEAANLILWDALLPSNSAAVMGNVPNVTLKWRHKSQTLY